MEIKVNNLKRLKTCRKTHFFILKIRISSETIIFPWKIAFFYKILIFHTKNCVFLRFLIVFKIIHFDFHLPNLRRRLYNSFFLGGGFRGPSDPLGRSWALLDGVGQLP